MLGDKMTYAIDIASPFGDNICDRTKKIETMQLCHAIYLPFFGGSAALTFLVPRN